MATVTPLRYPGGKSNLFETISELIVSNDLRHCDYAEPYAGGCGLALKLLFEGLVGKIFINDIDVAVWAFWESTLNHTEALVGKIETTEVTVDQWYIQQKIYKNKKFCDASSIVELGFSLFFLNRVNRSGIIKGAGIIGGKQQAGKYKIDCRYNKEDLIAKILRISKYKNKIELSKIDAIQFIKYCDENLSEHSLLYADPPYYNKGSSLYTNFYKHEDHSSVQAALSQYAKHWFLTYDDAQEIVELYSDFDCQNLSLRYSAQTKRLANELFISCPELLLPDDCRICSRQTAN